MKYLKKALVWALIIALCLNVCVFGASAENENLGVAINAALDKTSIVASDTAQTITLTVAPASPIWSCGFGIGGGSYIYCSDGLQISGISSTLDNFDNGKWVETRDGKVFTSDDFKIVSDTQATILWNSTDLYDISVSSLFQVQVTVPANTPAGEYKIGFTGLQVMYDNGNAYEDANGLDAEVTLYVTQKAATPTATFVATGAFSGYLTGLTDTMKFKLLDGDWTEKRYAVNITGLNTVPITIYVKDFGNGTTITESEVQEITVTKADAPTGLGSEKASSDTAADGKITGVNSNMEYCTYGSSVWTPVTGTEITGLAAGTYSVRVKANGAILASTNATVTVGAMGKEETPNATFTATGDSTGTLSGVASGMVYKIGDNGTEVAITGTSVDLTDLNACAIYVVKKGDGTNTKDSEAQIIEVTKADAPANLGSEKASSDTAADGKITGVNSNMEYCTYGSSVWTPVTGTEITGLAAGTYSVRVKANGAILASTNATVTVGAMGKEETPNATFTATGDSTGTLSGVASGMVYKIGATGTEVPITGTSVDLEGLTACTIYVINKGDGTNTKDSEAQPITVTKAEKPTGLKVVKTGIETDAADGQITGVTGNMEYKFRSGNIWNTCPNGDMTGLRAGSTYQIRVKASGTVLASDYVELTITAKTKAAEPNAAFTATGDSTGTLNGVTSGMVYKIDGGTEVAITDTSVDLTGLTACTITVINKGDGIDTVDSDPKTITVTKATEPTGLTAVKAGSAADAADGKITGTTSSMEYRKSGTTDSWKTVTGTEITGLTAGTYEVRVKATGAVLASTAATVTVGTRTVEETPNATVAITGADSVTLYGVESGMKYKVGDGAWKDGDGSDVVLEDLSACTIYVVKKGDGTETDDSVAQEIKVNQKAAPTGVTAVDCSDEGVADGKLIGVTTDMEYRKSGDADWTPGNGEEITGLGAANYEVRVKYTEDALASESITLSITDDSHPVMPTVTVTGTYTYNGKEQTVKYTGVDPETMDVKGITGINAGDYEIVVTSKTGKWKGGSTEPVTVKWEILKADPTYTVPQHLHGNQYEKLSTVALPTGWSWENGETVMDEVSMKYYKATYTPADTVNYNVVTGIDILVEIDDPFIDDSEEDDTQKDIFIDVFRNDYYYAAVNWAADKGITTGVDATHFNPNGVCTRAQAVTFLWRAAGSPEPKTTKMPFTDVASTSYYYKAVLWAVENGITVGTSDTTFSPNMNCSRAQIVTLLWRSQNSPEVNTANPFTDVAAGQFYTKAVLWAVDAGVTTGTSATTFAPTGDCTRAQIVTFIYRCMK